MGAFKEYDEYDGLGLADLIQRGEVSSQEVFDAARTRIEAHNPRLNAVVYPMFDLAEKAIQEGLPQGAFGGVPILLKDLLAAYSGVPMTSGSKAMKDFVPDHDSELVRRFKGAGMVILGKTNTPEFGLLGYTEPELFGATRNPWCLENTPGGSSGGSAAAVAARMVPIASGGDGGGSIRIPAAYCGLFGLKVSRGRNPSGPREGSVWQGAVVEHVITRTVRDSAAVLDAICGSDPGAPFEIRPPERSFLEETQRESGPLRIAFNTRSPLDTDVHPECVKAVAETAQLLEALGHHVEEAAPQLDGKALAASYLTLYMGEMAADLAALKTTLGRKARPSDVEALTWTLGLLGRTYSAGAFVAAMRLWGAAGRTMGHFHETYDLYLTPTTAFPEVKIGELKPKPAERVLMKIVNTLGLGRLLKSSGIVDKLAVESLSKTPFTQLANFTGQPAMSVPWYWTGEGLPVGVQFIAPMGDEAALFRLAAQIERARSWNDRRPAEF